MTMKPGQALDAMQKVVATHGEAMDRQVQKIRERAAVNAPESPTAAAEGYLAKLTRWDAMLNLGEPGKRALRKAMRAEINTIKRALLLHEVAGDDAPSEQGKEAQQP